ncbi:MAG: hypothetical protein II625_09105 [Bacilli bacterium]|nr:hypothetical protein [Bacilli bacterium]
MKQTVSGNTKGFDISCSDEDVEKSMNTPIGIRCADIYLRFPEIMEDEANDLAEFLEDEHIVYEGATDVFMEKDKEIERLNNIINTFEEDLEREVNISEQDSMVGNYRYTVIHSTLEKMLKYFRELKER